MNRLIKKHANAIARQHGHGTATKVILGINSLEAVNHQQQIIRFNIREAICEAKRTGITGMSYLNLKQVTDNRGLYCTVEQYNKWFEDAAKQVAEAQQFDLYTSTQQEKPDAS